MKTNENPVEEKKNSKKKGGRRLLLFATGIVVGGTAVYLYTRPEARKAIVSTGKKVFTGGKNLVTGMFKKKDPCTPDAPEAEGVILIRETLVPEVHTPKFENPRPRHRRENSNWTPRVENPKLNVNK